MTWQGKKQESSGRSPLKDKPLRYPGQSLDEHIDKVVTERATPWAVMAMLAGFWAVWEWFSWIASIPPQPYIATVVALFCVGLAYHKIRTVKREVKLLRQGRDGERAVAQYLDALREKHYRVFHDIIGNGFNLDHVIISPHGIYTVETKTYSKPTGRNATVRLEAGQLQVDGRSLDRDPIEQARAQSKWLRELLSESAGRSFPVRPVVVFPGWYVEPMKKNESREVWILHPKALPSFIENEPVALRADEVALAAFHLSRYIRTTNEEIL